MAKHKEISYRTCDICGREIKYFVLKIDSDFISVPERYLNPKGKAKIRYKVDICYRCLDEMKEIIRKKIEIKIKNEGLD